VAAAELVDAESTETGQHAFEVLAADVDAA